LEPEAKFKQPLNICCLHGDLAVARVGERLVSEISFLNEFKLFREVRVFQRYDQNVLAVRVEDKHGKDVVDWSEFTEKLRMEQTMDFRVWGDLIDDFSHKYQRILGRQCRKKPKSDLRRSYFSKVTQKTELHKAGLFQQYPCMELNF